MTPRVLAALMLAVASTAAGTAHAGPPFVDATAESGIVMSVVSGGPTKTAIVESTGSGVGLLDFDGDGRLDVFVANGSTMERLRAGRSGPGSRLFRNTGGGRFEDVTEAARAGVGTWAGAVAVADVDGDGWPDVLVTGLDGNALLRNRGDGTFEERAAAAGVVGSGNMTGAAFGDVDGDGVLDVWICRYVDFSLERSLPYPCQWRGIDVFCGPMGLEPASDIVLRGRGDGTFEDAGRAWGVAGHARSYGFTPLFLDHDGDGDQDVFVSNDTAANNLFRNESSRGEPPRTGGTRLRDVGVLAGAAFNGDGVAQASMGVDAADLNGDGREELFVTNFSHDSNTLLESSAGGTFRDATGARGLGSASLLTLGWATAFVDHDDDGDLDLLVVNGHVYPEVDGAELGKRYAQAPQLFRNEGGGRFRDVSAVSGPVFSTPIAGRGAAVGDLDDDGDLDVVVTQQDGPVVVWRNERPPDASWVAFRLVGRGGNRDAIGARVAVSAVGSEQVRVQRLQSGYLSSHDRRLHFGLGSASKVDRVTVRWPNGDETVVSDMPVRRVHEIQQEPERAVTSGGASVP